jgi:hypothetical protein
VWPQTKNSVGLWHVRQAWLNQACIKIKNGPICATALKSLGKMMYNIEYPYDQEMDVWAKCELERMANNLRVVEAFWLYVKSK